MICRGLKKCTRQNASLPSAKTKALGKDAFCRVPKNGTRQNTYLPSARKRHSAKTDFAECRKMALGKIHLCRVPEKKHSAKPYLSSFFYRVYFIWHSAKTVFTECPIKYTRQSLRHSAKYRFPVVNRSRIAADSVWSIEIE